MTALKKNRVGKRTAIAFCSAGAALLVVWIFFIGPSREETDWENYRAALEARGERLDWEDFIPPPVPDAENFFEAPGMRAWFSRKAWQTNGGAAIFELPGWYQYSGISLEELREVSETGNSLPISPGRQNGTVEDLRIWFARLEPEHRLLVAAASRPQARLNTDYSDPLTRDMVNFVNTRKVSQALAVRARLDLLDNDSKSATQSLLLIRKLADISDDGTHLAGAVLQSAIMELFIDVAKEGIQAGVFTRDELAILQESRKEVDLLSDTVAAIEVERASAVRILSLPLEERNGVLMTAGDLKFADLIRDDIRVTWKNFRLRSDLSSESAMAINKKVVAEVFQSALDQISIDGRSIHATKLEDWSAHTENLFKDSYHKVVVAGKVIPDFSRALVSVAQNQTLLDQLYVVCALERYRIQKGEYPESLEEIIPDYLDEVPDDLFSDDVLQYRNTGDGGFLLWSVGWDETDDDGTPVPDVDLHQIKEQKGDWVWGRSIMD